MVHFEPIHVPAQIAGVPSLLQRQRAHALPVRRPQVLAVGQSPQGQDGLLERLIDFVKCHLAIPITPRSLRRRRRARSIGRALSRCASRYGTYAFQRNTIGGGNTAIGHNALSQNVTGGLNIALGFVAGYNNTSGSRNIYIGSDVLGVNGEPGTIRLGGANQTSTVLAGIRGITTRVNDAIPIVIDSSGQLGTIRSSRRFKEEIHDMADASRRLQRLRPVTFRYTQAYSDGSKPVQFGLVAEEVAEVFPELAVRGADGTVETVHCETLNVLLLNEVQKQQRELQQQRRIDLLEQKLNDLLSERDAASGAAVETR
jgi:hypothetical protein